MYPVTLSSLQLLKNLKKPCIQLSETMDEAGLILKMTLFSLLFQVPL